LIEAHLYASPSPDSNAYFTTESAQIDAAEAILERRLEVPDYVDTPEDVLDVERWHHCLNINGTTETSIDHWLDDVAAFMKSIASLKSVVMTVTETHRIPADYPERPTPISDSTSSHSKVVLSTVSPDSGTKYPTAVRSRMSEACVDLLAPDGI